ncbi:MAG: hypothetical protein HZC36_06460 [Armatimonadetes bacterium]|nr:hypothetical protein [Armatimonadota bacterium]
MEIILWILVFAWGTAFVMGYTFVLYRFGRRLCDRTPQRWPQWLVMAAIGLFSLAVGLLGWFAPGGPFAQIATGICLTVLHCQSICVGFYAGREVRHQEDSRRWFKNTDDWLAEWECREERNPGESGTV